MRPISNIFELPQCARCAELEAEVFEKQQSINFMVSLLAMCGALIVTLFVFGAIFFPPDSLIYIGLACALAVLLALKVLNRVFGKAPRERV